MLEAILGAILLPIGLAIVGAIYNRNQSMWDAMAPKGCGMMVAAIAVYVVICLVLGSILWVWDQF